MALRLQQAAALLFQFLIGHAQLFLLGLQLLALALRFLQQHHQLCAQQRCTQRHADGLGAALQQLTIQVALRTRPGASQLDDAYHGAVTADRRQDALAHRQPPQAGLQFKYGVVAALQVTDALIPRHLPGHALLQCQRRRHAGRQRQAAGQLQSSAFQPVHGADVGLQLRAQAGGCRLGNLLRAEVAAQAHRYRVLGLLQPQRPHCVPACLDRAGDDQRDHQERTTTDASVDQRERRVRAGRGDVETDDQQDAGEHSHDERRAHTALEHRDAHGQEIRQPYRITERYHQLQCDGRSQQHGGRHPDPAVTRSRTRTHAGRFQNKKGG